MAQTNRTTRRSIAAASAVAALSLTLSACGGQQNETAPAQQPAEQTTAVQTTPAQTTPAQTSPSSAQGTNNPVAEDAAGSPEQVYAAIDTANASAAGMTAYKYDFDDTKHEIQVTDGQKEQQVTVSTDGSTVEKTGTDGIGNIVDDREDIVGAKVDMKAAMQAALGQVPGVPNEAELDRDHDIAAKDTLAWDITVVDANDDEHEVVVDATNGTVTKVDIDH